MDSHQIQKAILKTVKNPKNCEITFFAPDLSNRGEEEAFRAKTPKILQKKSVKTS